MTGQIKRKSRLRLGKMTEFNFNQPVESPIWLIGLVSAQKRIKLRKLTKTNYYCRIAVASHFTLEKTMKPIMKMTLTLQALNSQQRLQYKWQTSLNRIH